MPTRIRHNRRVPIEVFKIMRETGLRPTEAYIATFLYKHKTDAFSLIGISESVGIKYAVVNNSVSRLLKKGFIETSLPVHTGKKRQRIKFYTISKKKRKIIEKMLS